MHLRTSLALPALVLTLATPARSQADPALAAKFKQADQTLEYHLMVQAPPFRDPEAGLAGLLKALGPLGTPGTFDKSKDGIYLDTRDRRLDKARLSVRIRKGTLTFRLRSTRLEELRDLTGCGKTKYEMDCFDGIGYSISTDLKFEKDGWLDDPTEATLGDCLTYLARKCPSLHAQMEPLLKPVAATSAPGVARMWSAEFTFKHPKAGLLKECSLAAWHFPGTDQSLVELSWRGYVKDRTALDALYQDVRSQMQGLGLLSPDQGSKTERYFQAFYGPARR